MDSPITKFRVGNKIKKIREYQGITQDRIADRLKMSQANYSKIEKDEVELNLKRLEEIATILGVKTSDLINFEDRNIFLFTNNKSVSGVSGTVNNNYLGLENNERRLYEEQINLLNEKIIWLEKQVIRKSSPTVTYPQFNEEPDDKPESKSKK